jgi:hypothetical protein
MTHTLYEITFALIAYQLSWGGIAAFIGASHAGVLDRWLCPDNIRNAEES